MAPSFARIAAAAELRHGLAGVTAHLSVPRTAAELRSISDDRYLSQMSLRIFRAGLKHDLVDAKWPVFEEVWHGFDPSHCAAVYDEDLEAMLEDRRLIRHMGKLRAIRANAAAMLEVAGEYGSFGSWLAGWPESEIVLLWEALAKRFSQLGGNSAPMFLRMVGKDTFILTDSVVRALARWRAIESDPKGRAGRAAAQAVFSAWAIEMRRPLCQLSQILALSTD